MKRASLLIVVAALALAGCCNEQNEAFNEQDFFARCERNGLKIGSDEFKACESTLITRWFDKKDWELRWKAARQ